MIRSRTKSRLIPLLLAAAFLAVQAVALAHEINHDLRQHNDASCVLHLYSKHAGGSPAATFLLAPPLIAAHVALAPATTLPFSPPALGFQSRAPPVIG